MGASAISGTVWDTLIHGSRPRSANRQRSMRTASPMPTTTPRVKPMVASRKVTAAFLAR